MKTSHQEIINYWEVHEEESKLGIDWAEAHERCWRCADKSQLERCHIVPHSLGGSEDPSNLVLLCFPCHREAPNISDSRFMWIWLRSTCVPFYDTYWSIRASFEFEQMFGRLPFRDIGLNEKQLQLVEQFMMEEIKDITIHFGEGRVNLSTIACIFAKVEEKFTGQLPTPPDLKWGNEYALKVMGYKHNSLSINGDRDRH